MPQLTTFRLYLLGLMLLFAGYVVLEYNRPRPLDWNPSYANKDKIPYGTYVLFDQLPALLGTDSIEAVRLPVYNQLTGQSPGEPVALIPRSGSETVAAPTTNDSAAATATDTAAAAPQQQTAGTARPENTATTETPSTRSTVAGETEHANGPADDIPLRPGSANYLFINQDFELSRPDALALLQFVARGNDAFVATQTFSGARGLLRNRLGFDVDGVNSPPRKGHEGFFRPDSVDLRFSNPALARAGIRLPSAGVGPRLVVDSGRVGNTLATDAQGRAVFIRLAYGRGHFYVCTAPLAFTNYYLLRPRSAAFAAAALAYLPARRSWWDEFQKQGPVGEQSLLRVVFAHQALRLAYYLALVGGLLFVFVAARRRQRVIPIIRPLPNTTLLFTRTVAGLYRQGNSHALIAEKKVSLFMDYLRTRFQETNPDFGDADFRERLSQKSGLARSRVDELLRLVNFARTAPRVTDQQLLQLSRALNNFKQEVSR